jgi:putative copper resistance protein D
VTTRPAPRTNGKTAALLARPRWLLAVVAAGAAVALGALVAAGAFSGAFAPFQQFADPGVLPRWGTPVARTLSNLAAAVTLGSLVLAAFVLPAGRDGRRALTIAGVAAGVWTLAAVTALVLGTAWATFLPLSDPAFGTALWSYLTDAEVGRAMLRSALLAAVTSTTALLVRGPTGAAVAIVLVLGALGFQASTGHAAGSASHDLAVSAMFVHLVGAAIWVGGLAGIALLGHGATTRAATVRRYSAIAGWCFAAVAVSGLVSAWIRLGSVSALDTGYGTLLVVKALLLAALGGAGWLHRRNVVQHLEGVQRLDGGSGRAAGLFWRLAAVELAALGGVAGGGRGGGGAGGRPPAAARPPPPPPPPPPTPPRPRSSPGTRCLPSRPSPAGSPSSSGTRCLRSAARPGWSCT